MRTRLKEVVVVVSLLTAPLAFAESENTAASTEPAPVSAPPQENATGSEATAQQVALQTDTPQGNALPNIKVYPSF